MTRDIWDECQVADKRLVFPRQTWGQSMWPRAIREKRTLFSNEPSTLTPVGHIPIRRNVSVPILYRDQAIGLFQVANKETDYDAADVQRMETIAAITAPILKARLEREHLELVRKQAEEALRESEHRYRTLAESLPQLVWTGAPDGPCDYLSPQWLAYTGLPAAEQLGYGWAKQLHPDDWPRVQAAWADAVQAGGSFDIEFRIRRHDGVFRWFRTRATPLRNLTGQIVKWFGTNTDIEDLKQAEAKLRQTLAELEHSNKELEQFAYIASHDLQEPLRMVSSFTQLLARRYKGKLDADADDFIHFAVDGAERMQRLIRDLLAYSRAGRQGQQLAPVDANRAFDLAVANLSMAIQDSGAVVTREALPTVLAEESGFTQIFQNLIGNALKFHRPGVPPQAHVSAQQVTGDGQWLMVNGRSSASTINHPPSTINHQP